MSAMEAPEVKQMPLDIQDRLQALMGRKFAFAFVVMRDNSQYLYESRPMRQVDVTPHMRPDTGELMSVRYPNGSFGYCYKDATGNWRWVY